MNGFAKQRGQNSFDAGRPQPLRSGLGPRPAALEESYRQESLDGFERENPRYNPMNSERVQSSVLVDLKDPVQVHLLAETALLDSKEYEILSQEEVDELKKQCQVLNQRIEQTRSNLAIQSKYRDAAMSMSRLYSPTRAEGRRKSLLSNRLSGGSDAARETEAECDAIQKKCEDLASELWSLEKRLMEPQRRLLQHTAGILQLTHKATKKAVTPAQKMPPLVNGAPASPESMYTTSNGRNSLDFLDEGFVFDEASLYRSFDTAEMLGGHRQHNSIEIPLRSPVREQHKQLVEETDKLRDEIDSLRAQNQALLVENTELKGPRSDQWRLISDTETKLEQFNNQLREVIVKADPARNADYDPAPSGQLEPGEMISQHLDYLTTGLLAIGDSQGGSVETAGNIRALNIQVQDILSIANPSYPSPPEASQGVDEQLAYLRDSIQSVEDELKRAIDMTTTIPSSNQQFEQVEAVLVRLWEMIQSGYAEIRREKQERRKARIDKGLEPDEDDVSEGETFDYGETYSLPAFTTKIEWLYAQATRLQDQKAVLKRQIKQQRELNSKSDSEKDQQLRDKLDELEHTKMLLGQAEEETDDARSQLAQAFADLENLQSRQSEASAEVEEALGKALDQLKERNAKIQSLEATSRELQTRLDAAEANIQVITGQLMDASNARDEAEKAIKEKEKEVKDKEEELAQMTGMVAELKMEATLVKAELDGAYGSRKERAAEVAALANHSENSKVQHRVETLERELESTVKDLTDVVKQSLESEKKIGELEEELDKVRSDRTRLKDEKDRMAEDLEKQIQETTTELEERFESDIARLRKEKEQIQEELDKERFKSPGMPLSPGGAKGTAYLTDSYRVGLRAERKKYEEQLKAEQTVRRKLEDELRALRRAQGSTGRSQLSPRP
ncbi:Up-regulated during septation-domain-containing protein [Biscogniauxia sp. FL1348]|nr:Up-regulated during septation-domain-containing protein [Biscogniauxia sp. FL1348]